MLLRKDENRVLSPEPVDNLSGAILGEGESAIMLPVVKLEVLLKRRADEPHAKGTPVCMTHLKAGDKDYFDFWPAADRDYNVRMRVVKEL